MATRRIRRKRSTKRSTKRTKRSTRRGGMFQGFNERVRNYNDNKYIDIYNKYVVKHGEQPENNIKLHGNTPIKSIDTSKYASDYMGKVTFIEHIMYLRVLFVENNANKLKNSAPITAPNSAPITTPVVNQANA